MSSLTGVAVLCAIVALIILLRRDSRQHLGRRARRALRGASQVFVASNGRKSCQQTGGMSKAAIEELQFHLPTNQLRPSSMSRAPSLVAPEGHTLPTSSRPNTATSAFSETFRRPWPWKISTSKRSITPDPVRNPTPTFWVEEDKKIENPEKDDIEWRPPNEWDVVGPVGSNISVPAIPMPAFLKPPEPVDPRTIDPSTFPLPVDMLSAMQGRWSVSQAFIDNGHRVSSVSGDSVFCTCDFDDITEEQSGAVQAEAGRVSMGAASAYTEGRRCKRCQRISAGALLWSNDPSAPTTPVTPAFSRSSSVRKPRRKRRHEVSSKTKIAVAGRLYQGE